MAVIAVILVAAVALGAILIGPVTQTITQTITPAPPNYGTITVPDISLPLVQAGTSFSYNVYDYEPIQWITVVLGPDGVGKSLTMTLTNADAYTSYRVQLLADTFPEGATLQQYSGFDVEQPSPVDSIVLDKEGTYKFYQTFNGTAGNTTGSAAVIIDLTLEDTP